MSHENGPSRGFKVIKNASNFESFKVNNKLKVDLVFLSEINEAEDRVIDFWRMQSFLKHEICLYISK